MLKLILTLITTGALLAGCVAYEAPARDPNYSRRDRDRDGTPDRVDRDRDGDGVPNRQDNRPNDPRRY